MFLKFEWDPSKEIENLKKHKIPFGIAIQAFQDPLGFDLSDEKHSTDELRRFWVGKIIDGRVITIRYTLRGDVIRIFGAAQWREFREIYYEKTKIKQS